MNPRVLFVGRTRYELPLEQSLARKWDALRKQLDLRVLAAAKNGARGDETFHLVRPGPGPLDGLLFYALLPFRAARELREFRPDVVIAESPYEAFAVELARPLARSRARVVVEVHGDWRTATRMYGSRLRNVLNPLADRLAALAVKKADAVRTLSPYTTGLVRDLGREPAAIFPTWTDLEAFLEQPIQPLPDPPRIAFIGVLEPYKNVEKLAAAWRLAAPRLPGVVLHMIGTGTRTDVAEALLRDLPEQTEWSPRLSASEVADALDRSTLLLLPSRSEGLARVIIEALSRGRPVVAARVGGIPNLVEDGVNGVLLDPEDVKGLADTIVRVVSDDELVARLASVARQSVDSWLWTADEYAARVRTLVERASGSPAA